jgi:hypothetical protein
MTEQDVFIVFAKVLINAIPDGCSYKYCTLQLERLPNYSSVWAKITDYDANIQVLDIETDLYDIIQDLYTITQTQPPIHKDWNKAVFTLYPDGEADMEYIWDAEWQAEIDRYNEEAERSRDRGN